MGAVFDYFRAADREAALRVVEIDGPSPDADAVPAKWVEPSVVLGRLIAFIEETEWSPQLAEPRMISPDEATRPTGRDALAALPADSPWLNGPFLAELKAETRASLADAPDARLPALAERWAMTEELSCDGMTTGADLLPLIRALTGLARRARAADERLYCWWPE